MPADAAVIAATQGVRRDHELFVKNMNGRNGIDPFVIAVARVRGAVVVTGEGGDGSADKPKNPYVCNQIGFGCIRFLDVVREEGWRF